MNCETFHEFLVERIYGRLPSDREIVLQQHARECADCAVALQRTLEVQNVFDPGENIPEPDYETAWRSIQERTQRRTWRWPVIFPARRFAMAAAAVALVFVIGVFAGRSLFSPEPEPDAAGPGYQGVASIAAYTESLEPLLLDFANHGGKPVDDELAELTQKVAADMLVQTRLLKRAAARSGDEQLYVLLDDIELVLISMSNLGGQNGDIAAQLLTRIREKSLLFRIKQMPASQRTI
ncbi:MAG: hypothetical protein KAT30_12490, partial [Candidatus Krumholzibacteria bacterium]|nr:hypothetical protein [Candidatus Krumholzibacteria bacterium]